MRKLKLICCLCLITIIYVQCEVKDDSYKSDKICNVQAQIVDSILVSTKEFLGYLDINRNRRELLFSEFGSTEIIYKLDFDGNVLSKSNPWGKGNEGIGTEPCSIGYVDGGILISTESGYYLLNDNGESEVIIKNRNPFPVILWRKLIDFGKNSRIHLCVDRLSYQPGVSAEIFSQQYYEATRFFSRVDLEQKTVDENLHVGYGKSSMFINTPSSDLRFPDIMLWYCQYKDGIAVLFNPDNKLYLYSSNSLSSPSQTITLKPDNWSRGSHEEVINMSPVEAYSSNSSYSSICEKDDSILVCYREKKKESELFNIRISNIFIDDSQKNCFFIYPDLTENDLIVQSSEFTIPNKIGEVLVHLYDDVFLCSANSSIIEKEDSAIFYKVRMTCK